MFLHFNFPPSIKKYIQKYEFREDGRIYTVTDVEDLFEWMTSHLSRHPLFQRLDDADMKADPVVAKLFESSEEGQKVSRNSGEKWCAVYRRICDSHSQG